MGQLVTMPDIVFLVGVQTPEASHSGYAWKAMDDPHRAPT